MPRYPQRNVFGSASCSPCRPSRLGAVSNTQHLSRKNSLCVGIISTPDIIKMTTLVTKDAPRFKAQAVMPGMGNDGDKTVVLL